MMYRKENALGLDLIIAEHKGVVMSLCEGDDWISIYTCESENEGKGYTQEAIELVKCNFYPKKIFGSVPLNTVMKHIYDKTGVIYEE